MTDIEELLRAQNLQALCLTDMKENLSAIGKDIAVLKERSYRVTENCPQRVAIAQNAAGVRELREDIREAVIAVKAAVDVAQNNRVQIARLLLGSGITGGAVVAAIQALVALLK